MVRSRAYEHFAIDWQPQPFISVQLFVEHDIATNVPRPPLLASGINVLCHAAPNYV